MSKICNKCGSVNEDSMRFCINCGNAFAQAQVQMPEQPKIKRPIYEQTDYAAIDARNAAKQQAPVQQSVMQNPMQAQPLVQQQIQYGQQMYAPANQIQQPAAKQKAPKKKNTTPIIIAIVAAVVVIGVALGVIFGIVLPNKNKGKEDTKEQSAPTETAIEIQPTAKTIATGVYNVFAVKKDGTVVATGDNSHGACDVAEWTDIVAVSSAGDYTLGLKSDGTVVATEYKKVDDKDEYSGECDVDDWTDIVSVVAAGDHSVGLKSDGTVVAVGKNLVGRCDVQDWSDIVAISASARNTIGLKSDGTVVATGDNANGECEVEKWKDIIAVASGAGITAGLKADGTVIATGDNTNGACDVDSWSDIVAIATAYDIIYGLKKDGTILSTKDGVVDNDSDFIKISYMLGEIEKWKDIIAISTNGLGTEVIGLKADGTVVAVTITDYWREEYDDDLGFEFDVSDWTDIQTTVPERFRTEIDFGKSEAVDPGKTQMTNGKAEIQPIAKTITTGMCYVIAVNEDRTVVTTGKSSKGETDVSGWTDIVALSSAYEYTLGLKIDGTVVAVGSNEHGQCNVNGWTDIVAVSAGYGHSVGVKSDGTVVATGWNSYGQCDIDGWTDIVAVSAGQQHTVGIKSDGTVVAVGNNLDGQCDVSGWTDVVAVAAGACQTIGLKSDGTVVAKGNNVYGRCNVDGWTDIVAIAAGGYHTVGLKSDGKVVAVGDNSEGQCNVTEWTDIVAVAADGYFTVGLKGDGTVVMIGSTGLCDVSSWTDIQTTIPEKFSGKVVSHNGGSKPSKPSSTVDVTTPVIEAPTEKTTEPAKQPVSTDWKAAYNSYLKTVYNNKNEYDVGDMATFGFAYITDDDIPELLIARGPYYASSVFAVSFADGEVVEIGDFGSYGTLHYIERESVILSMFENQGRFVGHFIRINDDFSQETEFSYFNNADMEGVDVIYEINGEKVSKAEYDAEVAENWPDRSVISSSGKYENQYDFTLENIDKYCK